MLTKTKQKLSDSIIYYPRNFHANVSSYLISLHILRAILLIRPNEKRSSDLVLVKSLVSFF